ncbi:MAG: NAD(P)/FAD-dependent oxidoreductase [Planctomycetota bacterium]|nr:NAD(P)/FAD-dependent oxidoreductase [Planctomycetota bacterium]
MAEEQKITNIVVVGAGFGGVNTARVLGRLYRGRNDICITLISRENYFLMTPLLFEAASGVLEPRHAVSPIRKMLENVQFVQALVEQIDIEKGTVIARLAHEEAREFPYDLLVIALGGVSNTRLIAGSDTARTFKTLGDAISLRNHCIRIFERANVESDPQLRKSLLTFVIIGGGLVGVELQGELTEFTRNICSAYPRVNPAEISFELIEGGPHLVPELDADLGKYVEDTFGRRGIHVRLNSRVSKVEPTSVHLGEETIKSSTIILATGVVPNPLIATLPLEKDSKGRLVVEPTMRCAGHPNIWALGDCAAIPDPQGHPYPPLAQHALREARLLARNIHAVLQGEEPKPFIYKNKGTLAALGQFKGVGRVYKIKIYGFLAWWVWRTYYLLQTPRLNRKIRIVLDWTIALFFKNDVVELDMSSRR